MKTALDGKQNQVRETKKNIIKPPPKSEPNDFEKRLVAMSK